jgi:Ca-activated chloride channel family protein
VSNEDEILALARRHAGTSRIFAFGIGAGASEHLVRGAARASGGAAEMIFPGERIEPKVLRTFARVRAPVLDDVRIDWKGLRVEQSPARLPPAFGGDPLTIFARVTSGTASEIDLVIGERRFSVALDLEHTEPGGALPVLWARELIRELEDRDGRPGSSQQRPEAETSRQKRLVELGLRYGLLSSATSFVAVEERSSTDQVTSPAELRRIPVALTNGWGEQSRGAKGIALGFAGGFAGVTRRGHLTRAYAMAAPPPAPSPMPSRSALGGIVDRVLGKKSAASVARSAASASAPAPSFEGSATFAPPAAKARETSDGLFDLLMTQRAEGSFVLSRALDALLGTERAARLKAAAATASETLVVTSVVVLLLEREHDARASEWRPAIDKAKAWLAKQPTKFDAQSVV